MHVLCTLPAPLVIRSGFDQVQFLPTLNLRTQTGEDRAEGFATARRLLTRRVPLKILEQLLGPHAEVRIQRMIAWSGGQPRELVRMLQEALGASKTFPLSNLQLERVLNQIRDEYEMLMTTQALSWLARVAVTKQLSVEVEAEVHDRIADSMISNGAIVCYQDDLTWYDLLPAVRHLPGMQKKIDELERTQRLG